MKKWLKIYCRFCNQPIEDFKIFPPGCKCDGYKEAKEKRLEEIKNEPGYEKPLGPEEYDKKFPITFKGSHIVQDKDGEHKLVLEARACGDSEGLEVYIPFDMDKEDGASLSWGFTDVDAVALHRLLSEYLIKKSQGS
jgi:hypothetical protein